jgi:hypothetical protein
MDDPRPRYVMIRADDWRLADAMYDIEDNHLAGSSHVIARNVRFYAATEIVAALNYYHTHK